MKDMLNLVLDQNIHVNLASVVLFSIALLLLALSSLIIYIRSRNRYNGYGGGI